MKSRLKGRRQLRHLRERGSRDGRGVQPCVGPVSLLWAVGAFCGQSAPQSEIGRQDTRKIAPPPHRANRTGSSMSEPSKPALRVGCTACQRRWGEGEGQCSRCRRCLYCCGVEASRRSGTPAHGVLRGRHPTSNDVAQRRTSVGRRTCASSGATGGSREGTVRRLLKVLVEHVAFRLGGDRRESP